MSEQPGADLEARLVRVRGTVQGVLFRASCVQEARRAGVRGWVRNEPDGTVLAHLEGRRDAVEQVQVWCHEGPVHAVVSGVEARAVAVEGWDDFEQHG